MGGVRLTVKLNITHMGIEQHTKQDSGEANFVDLVEGKYGSPDNGRESVQGQIETQEARLQGNVARLQENVGRLPDDAEIKDEGIKAKVVEYKEMLLRNREDFMTKIG